MTYPFLSPEWIDEARRIRDEFRDRSPSLPAVKLNQIITGVPFGDDKTIKAHIDTSSGDLTVDVGHLEAPEATMTIPYDVARALFVEGNAQAAMQAFMSGHIKVEGDLGKLLTVQETMAGGNIDPVQAELQARLKAITSDV